MAELAKPEYTGAFENVKVTFSGQDATVTGKVSSQAEHELLTTIIAEKVRTPGSSLNPVTSVSNGTGMDYAYARLHPKPWLLAAHFNGQGVITGLVPNELKDKAVQALTAKLGSAKVTSTVNVKLEVEAKVRPAVNAEGSLDAKALPALADGDIAISTLTGAWATLKANRTDIEVTNELNAAGASIDSSEVIEALLPLRNYQAAEAEKARQATLPLAYAGIIALKETLQIYGLAGDEESSRRFTEAVSAAYPKRRVVTTAMKVSTQIHNNADWTAAVKDLPKGEADVFVAALTAGGKTAVYKDKGDQAAMEKALSSLLPKDFDFKTLWEPYSNWLTPPPSVPSAPVPAPVEAAPTSNIKIGQPQPLSIGPGSSGLKLSAPQPVKTLPPPSGNPTPSPVTIPTPPPAPVPAPAPASTPAVPAPASAPTAPPAK